MLEFQLTFLITRAIHIKAKFLSYFGLKDRSQCVELRHVSCQTMYLTVRRREERERERERES